MAINDKINPHSQQYIKILHVRIFYNTYFAYLP